MAAHTPLNIRLQHKRCLVAGGGKVAERKIRKLLRCEADVVVCSPRLTERLQKEAEQKRLHHLPLTFQQLSSGQSNQPDLGIMRDLFLVIAATDCAETNRLVHDVFRDRVPLLNIVDRPDLCTFFFPALVERGALQLAVSTSGQHPMLARKICTALSETLGPDLENELQRMIELREELKRACPDPTERRNKLEAIYDQLLHRLLKE
jgi:precorrin-2 dehydrogenase / sirohydrochlorin ferrochelatase